MEQKNNDALKRRGFLALEDGDWKQANEFFDSPLNQNAEDSECYIGKLMATMHVRHRDEIQNCTKTFENNPDYQKALRFDPSIEPEFREVLNCIHENRRTLKAKMLTKAKTISKWVGISVACIAVFILIVSFIVKIARRCPDCKGNGTVECVDCDDGKLKCTFCNDGKVECTFCEGKKILQCGYCLDDSGKSTGTVPCEHCNEDGIPYCTICEGEGRIESGRDTCRLCNGKGYTSGTTCSLCHGKGYYWSLGSEHYCLSCSGTGYSAKKECVFCGGDGWTTGSIMCSQCSGTGLSEGKCNFCKGTHLQTCQYCGGKKELTCSTCKGSAQIECSKCKGKAYIECSRCHGKAYIECSRCRGTGTKPKK